eukprot:gene16938-20148_t
MTLEELMKIPEQDKKVDTTTTTTAAAAITPEPVKKTEVVEFAGERIEREVKVISPQPGKPMAKAPKGLEGLLSGLGGKPKKLSTLEKSQMDWDKFKSSGEVDKGDIENQKKNGFLEKQAFLQRTDDNQLNTLKSLQKKK